MVVLLKSLLKGSATTTAQRFDGDATEDYDDVWRALVRRFNKPECVVRHFIMLFSDIAAPTEENIDDLRLFHGEVCRAINKLKRANRDVNDEIFTHTLANKIHTPNLRAHIRERQREATRSGTEWHTTAILDCIEEFLQELEEIDAANKDYGIVPEQQSSPKRTFVLHDGKRVRIRCAEGDLVWVEPCEDGQHSPVTTHDRFTKKTSTFSVGTEAAQGTSPHSAREGELGAQFRPVLCSEHRQRSETVTHINATMSNRTEADPGRTFPDGRKSAA
ncbi:hypothetical protein AAVH_36270 [Aphelenchoides avenae]|nr:hypothetical protein AAVH_36270 [Aphelenchus avenae]